MKGEAVMNWIQLKSGSDVRGKAVGDGALVTENVAKALGMAFAQKIARETGKPIEKITIALGRDSRVSGPALLAATAEGITRTGASVLEFGMCTTPAMFMSIITPGFEPDGSIMITASHHPWDRNGLKFFTGKGGIESRDVEELPFCRYTWISWRRGSVRGLAQTQRSRWRACILSWMRETARVDSTRS